MCADRSDHGVPEVLKAADGCKCEHRWCESRTIPFPRVEDIVRYQAEPGGIESDD